MIHRSQDELVEAHADRILADERAVAALMAHFESQLASAERGGPLRHRLRAAGRAILRALTTPAGISESIVGITPDDQAGDAPTTPPSPAQPPTPPPQYPDGWPWPW